MLGSRGVREHWPLAWPAFVPYHRPDKVSPSARKAGECMRFATIETPAGPKAVVVDGQHYIDLQSVNSMVPPSLRQILAGGPLALRAVQEAIRFPAAKRNDLTGV